MSALFAQYTTQRAYFDGPLHSWSIGDWLISLLIICAVVAIVLVVLREFEIPFPAWLRKILVILVVLFVGIVAIRFALSL